MRFAGLSPFWFSTTVLSLQGRRSWFLSFVRPRLDYISSPLTHYSYFCHPIFSNIFWSWLTFFKKIIVFYNFVDYYHHSICVLLL